MKKIAEIKAGSLSWCLFTRLLLGRSLCFLLLTRVTQGPACSKAIYSLWQVCGLFNIPCWMQETRPMFYSPYLRRLECLTICRFYYKGSTFSSLILRPSVLVQSGAWTLNLPHSRLVLYQLSQPGTSTLFTNYWKQDRNTVVKIYLHSVTKKFSRVMETVWPLNM